MEDRKENSLSKLRIPIILFVLFWGIAILFWQLKRKHVFSFNFGYIGTAIALGTGAYVLLPRKKKSAGRRFAHFLVGLYMLGSLRLINYRISKSRAFSFIYSKDSLPGLSLTILLQRSLFRSFSEGSGADGRAGLPWSWTTFHIRETNQGGFLLGGKNYGTSISGSVLL